MPLKCLRTRALIFPLTKRLTGLTFFILLFLSQAALAQSLSLEQALGLSQKSPAVQLAQAQLNSTQKQLAIASSLFSGTLTTGYKSSQVTAPNLSSPQGSSGFDPIAVTGSFNLLPYGPRYDAKVQAEASFKEAELALKDAKATAYSSALKDYFTALRAAQDIEVNTLAVGLAQTELSANQVRYEAGAISATDFAQAQIALQQAQTNLGSAQIANSAALLSLSTLLGVEVESVEDASMQVDLPTDINKDSQIMLRSDVQKAFFSLEQTKRNAAATLRDNLPSGSLSLAYQETSQTQSYGLGLGFDTSSFQPSVSANYDFDFEPSGSSLADSSTLSFSLGLTVPLDSSLADALALSDIAVQQAQLNYEQVLQSARLTVTNAEQQLKSLEASLALSQEVLTQAEATLNYTQKRFDLGLVSQLAVLNAQLNLKQQELSFKRAEDSLLSAQVTYIQSLALDPMEVF